MGNTSSTARTKENHGGAEYTRIFACSDLHVDHQTNWEELEREVREGGYRGSDVLIVAGDVSSELDLLCRTLELLVAVFHGRRHDEGEDGGGTRQEGRMSNVFFCPGNNELRVTRSDKRAGVLMSLEKLDEVLRLCAQLGVHTRPAKVNGQVWVVPLMAWYTPRFDPEWSSGGDGDLGYRCRWLDFRACVWPEELELEVDGVANHFVALSERRLRGLPVDDAPVVSFSHFLPRFELLPMRTFLRNKTLPLVVGDGRLDEQIRRIGSQVHVFGHTHINKDQTIDGVRYVQNALGHPAERKKLWHLFKGSYSLKLVFQSGDRSREVRQVEQGRELSCKAHLKSLF